MYLQVRRPSFVCAVGALSLCCAILQLLIPALVVTNAEDDSDRLIPLDASTSAGARYFPPTFESIGVLVPDRQSISIRLAVFGPVAPRPPPASYSS